MPGITVRSRDKRGGAHSRLSPCYRRRTKKRRKKDLGGTTLFKASSHLYILYTCNCVTLRFQGNESVTAASPRVLTSASALTLTPPNATHVPNLGVVRLCGGGDFEELSRSADVAQVFLHQSPRHHHRQGQRIPGKREPDWSSDRQR